MSRATLAQVANRQIEIAILPWGAIEPHNSHLPYMTDCILSQCVALEAARLSTADCTVLPPIYMGQQNPGQRDYPLCIHTSMQTQMAILRDIVCSLSHQGIKKLVIINGHGGNSFRGIIRDLAVEFEDMMILCSDWFAIVPRTGFFDASGEHADELETSVMMHYHPELVDLSVAGSGVSVNFALESLRSRTAWLPRNWQAVSSDTGIGDPRGATAEKGRAYSQAVVAKYVQLLNELASCEQIYEPK